MVQNDFISFAETRNFLTEKFGRTPSEEEFWMWCFFGKEAGLIDAYVGDLSQDPVYQQLPGCGYSGESDIADCIKPLKRWFFLRSEVEAFKPVRYMTANELVKRWKELEGSEEKAIKDIEAFATEHHDYKDVTPRLRNQFIGAGPLPSTGNKFIPLKGVYLLEDVLDVERYLHINEISRNDEGKQRKERELTTWLRETWIKEGMLTGTPFFNALKKYQNQKGSPIVDHWTTGKDSGGIRWITGNATGERTKKTIQTKASAFKKEHQKNMSSEKNKENN